MKTRIALFSAMIALAMPNLIIALPNDTPVEITPTWLSEPDFWIAAAANTAGLALFMARVHAPNLAEPFGYLTEAIGAPALGFAIADIAMDRADAATVGLLSYAAWALGAALVDHVFQVEYREPRNQAILIPYVVGYYAGIGLLSATQLRNGKAPWIIAGAGCMLTVAASFYALSQGAD